jgi:hypothetical protein
LSPAFAEARVFGDFLGHPFTPKDRPDDEMDRKSNITVR